MYSIEQLISEDPDIILVGAYDESAVEGMVTDSRYQTIRAVQEGNVFPINADTSSRPGPRIIDALEEIAATILNYK
jgi:iron complex transport system substrate-binding protein